jgi:hypothetical protein
MEEEVVCVCVCGARSSEPTGLTRAITDEEGRKEISERVVVGKFGR